MHELVVRVAPDDIDRLGHVNNLVYLRWVQDVAGAHWEAAATPEQRQEIAWVAIRHEIDYRRPGFEGDEISVRTWVEAWSGVTSDRHTEIVRVSDGVLLARARTVWCAVDPSSLKPRKVRDAVRSAFVEDPHGPGTDRFE